MVEEQSGIGVKAVAVREVWRWGTEANVEYEG